MREIEFRGLAMSGGWVYGNYIHSKRFEGCSNEYRIHNVETGLESDVYPETVGQYTGLKDKEGVKIYEGDIVETFSKSRYECQYGLYSGIMLFKSIADARDSYFLAELHNPVVIGNIHENKKLLENEKI